MLFTNTNGSCGLRFHKRKNCLNNFLVEISGEIAMTIDAHSEFSMATFGVYSVDLSLWSCMMP